MIIIIIIITTDEGMETTHSMSLKRFDWLVNSYFTDMYYFVSWTWRKAIVVLPVHVQCRGWKLKNKKKNSFIKN